MIKTNDSYMNWDNPVVKFGEMIGKKLVKIEGLEEGSETVQFTMGTGEVYQMHYYPD